MFDKILIANRSEIACRIAATARRLGISTVAVYSDADAASSHVAACDEAVRIGPPAATESYLNGAAIIAAARATGAQAIHPGYGFLSENEDFACACDAAGLVFIGPSCDAIAAMGSKSAAKALMQGAGVPLVPGYHGDHQEPDFLHAQADAIGYPVLLKPSAGGGGKGMQIVRESKVFAEQLATCVRTALSAFGDGTVLIEKYLENPRHVEIQIFGDTQGNQVHLFERDCSVQRRHQKVIEEAPAPQLTPEQRQALASTALACARATAYVGAGTVEFILDETGQFYFMEMNTRLQVEHPVTEMITGIDLVEWQLRVASGEPLPLTQAEIKSRGHAFEARLYAENSEKDFLPATGHLTHMGFPEASVFRVEADQPWRIDAGVRAGDTISSWYDPMVAKLIVHGDTREAALAQLRRLLAQVEIAGLTSNLPFLQHLTENADFASVKLSTRLIENHLAALTAPPPPPCAATLALASIAWLARECESADGSPWAQRDGWRLGSRQARTLHWRYRGEMLPFAVAPTKEGWRVLPGSSLRLIRRTGEHYRIVLGEQVVQGRVRLDAHACVVFHAGQTVGLELHDHLYATGCDDDATHDLCAPMPGRIAALLAQQDQAVVRGTPLIVLEAMKMEHTIAAPHDGKVVEFLYRVGDQVNEGARLFVFQA